MSCEVREQLQAPAQALLGVKLGAVKRSGEPLRRIVRLHGVAADVAVGSANEVVRMDEVEATLSDPVKQLTPDRCGRNPFHPMWGIRWISGSTGWKRPQDPGIKPSPSLAFFAAVGEQLHPETDTEGRYALERQLPNASPRPVRTQARAATSRSPTPGSTMCEPPIRSFGLVTTSLDTSARRST